MRSRRSRSAQWRRAPAIGGLLWVASCGGSSTNPPEPPVRPDHTPLAIVIIHGVGNQDAGYSKPLQDLLRPRYPAAYFEEVLWSDLGTVLGLRVQESPEQRAERVALESFFDQSIALARASRLDPTEAAQLEQQAQVERGYLGPIVRYEFITPAEREKIQERLRSVLDWSDTHADHTVVIGHSLGSVVAFDVLDGAVGMPPAKRADLFCTLGSPLAKSLFLGHGGRSKKRPVGAASWRNIYSPHDLIANALAHDYADVSDLQIDTSSLPLTAHSAYWTHADVVADLAQRIDAVLAAPP
jgi:hypothetical protein